MLEAQGNFKVEPNHFLIENNATADAIRKMISDLFWQTDPADVVIFYFAGHGFEDGYRNAYLAPYDMDKGAPFVKGIRMQELKELFLVPSGKRAAVLLLDCCHSRLAVKGARSDGDAPLDLDQFFTGQREPSGEGRLIVSSAGADRTARELPGCRHRGDSDEPHTHGLFTYHLLKGLEGEAQIGGAVRLGRLLEHVRNSIEEPHRPRKYVADNLGVDDTILVISPAELARYTENEVSKIEDILKIDKQPVLMLEAVKKFGELRHLEMLPPSFPETEGRLSNRLKEMRIQIIRCYWTYKVDVEKEIEGDLALELSELVQKFNLDYLAKIPKARKALVSCLLNSVLGSDAPDEDKVKYFLEVVQACRPPKARPSVVGGPSLQDFTVRSIQMH